MSCTLLQMLVILHKMTAAPCKMSPAPRVMLAVTYLMFAKDQRGGLRSPPGPQGQRCGCGFLELKNVNPKTFCTRIFVIYIYMLIPEIHIHISAPLPLYLKKLKCLEMIFRTLGTKNKYNFFFEPFRYIKA